MPMLELRRLYLLLRCHAPLSCSAVMLRCHAPLSCSAVMLRCHAPLSCSAFWRLRDMPPGYFECVPTAPSLTVTLGVSLRTTCAMFSQIDATPTLFQNGPTPSGYTMCEGSETAKAGAMAVLQVPPPFDISGDIREWCGTEGLLEMISPSAGDPGAV